mmetsp:Transcript_18892/g.55437  ORF Transcript_18892/g.55437 Transcript_18892/m.55437 type:complete len:300 (+) Transcript_18892:283-1182(+)
MQRDDLQHGARLLAEVHGLGRHELVLEPALSVPLLHLGPDVEDPLLEEVARKVLLVLTLVLVLERAQVVCGDAAEQLRHHVVKTVHPELAEWVHHLEARDVAAHAFLPVPGAALAVPALHVLPGHLLLALGARGVPGVPLLEEEVDGGAHRPVLGGAVGEVHVRHLGERAARRGTAAAPAAAALGERDAGRGAPRSVPGLEHHGARVVRVQLEVPVEGRRERLAVPVGHARALDGEHVPGLPREGHGGLAPDGHVDEVRRVVRDAHHALGELLARLGGEGGGLADCGEDAHHVDGRVLL